MRLAGWVIATTLVAAVGLGWAMLRPDPEEAGFEAYVAELRTKGEPVTWDDLLGPEVPDEQNCVAGVDEAWQSLVAEFGSPESWRFSDLWTDGRPLQAFHQGSRPEQVKALAEFSVQLRPFVDRVDAATCRTWCRVTRPAFGPSDRGAGSTRALERVTLQVVHILCAAAVADPEPSTRVRAAATALRLAERLAGSGSLPALDQDVVFGSVNRLLRDGATCGRLPPALLRPAVSDLLTESRLPTPEFILAQARVRAIQSHLTPRRRSMSLSAIWNRLLGSRPALPEPSGDEIVAWCRPLDLAISAARTPGAKVTVTFDTKRATADAWSDFRLFDHEMCIELAMALPRTLVVTRTGLAVLEFHEQHHDWPSSIEAFAGQGAGKGALGGFVPEYSRLSDPTAGGSLFVALSARDYPDVWILTDSSDPPPHPK